MNDLNKLKQQFEACMLAGAIGDAWGSCFENMIVPDNKTTFYLYPPKAPEKKWAFTDDTQLTMATCEALCAGGDFDAALLANKFVRYYKEKRLTGLGASSLKAIIELEAGAHWSQVGREGEYAAGNGAAMRIAPLAFFSNISRQNIRDACRITHRNDEAYVGALAIFLSIKSIISGAWWGENNLFDLIISELPDTRVRDRLIEINAIQNSADIKSIAQLGNNGYVVNSIPFAIFAATQVHKIGLRDMYKAIIDAGGDTDTNASLAGQIAGALYKNIPAELLSKLKAVDNIEWMMEVVKKTRDCIIV
ncbi:ADP-ribosylglycohydrolase family protein [Niastella sp. OAS944]|uniref:ADP-ribosylglycohydrolase family protein n=1 Tax=Niastella sp. OAS944 TaxID=2664089 RepID=UPI0034868082|nr:ADP-ribosylglycohydrolase [Chitinophagaceae bacterium OAS944]